MSYTVTAHNSSGQGSTTIQLRTADAYIVNNNGDVNDATPGDNLCETATGNGQCTLRAAFTEINADGGTKSVAIVLAQTIQLQSELPAVTQSIEVVGVDTNSVVIDGGANQLTFYNATGVSLKLAYLTIRNATQINPNFQTGIDFSGDHILVTGCGGFVNVGGANSTLELRDSMFIGNSGNVVYATAAITIDRCTFAANTPAPTGGVTYFVFGSGAVTNCTFDGNSGTGSVAVVDNANITFAHNTFSGNASTDQFRGGAFSLYSGSTTMWTNNLFVNNIGDTGTCAISGAFSSDGGNLVFPADANCQFTAPRDPAPADPQLVPLAQNGGPTLTMALGDASPAINAANDVNCTPTDQRGVPRPMGAACDIGAVEQR